jgi:predicted transcriptional regulator
MTYIQVKDKDGLIRDTNTGAIINTNYTEYKKYLELKEKNQSSKEQIDNIQEELSNLKDDIKEIKNLLYKLLK